MDSTDILHLQQRARWAYERGRLQRGLLGIAPVLAVVTITASVTHRPETALRFGLATVGIAAAMLWYGREPQKAVLPGIVAGLVPLALALCANRLHVCGGDGCSSLCVPACALGGVVAGLAVASVGNERRAGPWFWLSASSLALLTGAMGCACVGYTGILGLGVGFGAGTVPGLLRRAFREKKAT